MASGVVRPGGHAGGGEGLVRQGGDLGLGQRRSLFRFRGLVYATGKQRHRDRGHRREGVGRDAHRLATWIELSHRSPTNNDADTAPKPLKARIAPRQPPARNKPI